MVQLVVVFHILKKEKSKIDYEGFKNLFKVGKKNFQTNMGMINNGCQMEKCMNFLILQMTKEVVNASQYIRMSCNFEFMTKIGHLFICVAYKIAKIFLSYSHQRRL
jgi:hypothetical protein